MNAKAMGKLIENKEIKKLWVPGAGQDDSTCIGAAIEVQKQLNRGEIFFVDLKNLYFGNNANEEETEFVKKIVNKKKYKIIKFSDKKAAELLSKGKILGRVVDRMEFGPRSLGNRSILADPRNLNTKTKINAKIKNRDFNSLKTDIFKDIQFLIDLAKREIYKNYNTSKKAYSIPRDRYPSYNF